MTQASTPLQEGPSGHRSRIRAPLKSSSTMAENNAFDELEARGAGSGAAVDQLFWYAIEMGEGLQRRARVLGERADALKAVGLRE
jgi:hypothetical protein